MRQAQRQGICARVCGGCARKAVGLMQWLGEGCTAAAARAAWFAVPDDVPDDAVLCRSWDDTETVSGTEDGQIKVTLLIGLAWRWIDLKIG